jgi:hypothetical protein
MLDLKIIFNKLNLTSTYYSRWSKKTLAPFTLGIHYMIEYKGKTTLYLLSEPFFITLAAKLDIPDLKDFILTQKYSDTLITSVLPVLDHESQFINFIGQMDILSKHNIKSGYTPVTEDINSYVFSLLVYYKYIEKVIAEQETYYRPTTKGIPYCLFCVYNYIVPGVYYIWKEDFIDKLKLDHTINKNKVLGQKALIPS